MRECKLCWWRARSLGSQKVVKHWQQRRERKENFVIQWSCDLYLLRFEQKEMTKTFLRTLSILWGLLWSYCRNQSHLARWVGWWERLDSSVYQWTKVAQHLISSRHSLFVSSLEHMQLGDVVKEAKLSHLEWDQHLSWSTWRSFDHLSRSISLSYSLSREEEDSSIGNFETTSLDSLEYQKRK